MLNQEQYKELADAVGVTPAELQDAITSEEEKEITIVKLNRFTDEELSTRLNNSVRDAINGYSQKELGGIQISGDDPTAMVNSLGKLVYDDGKKASTEMYVKSWKEKNGADFQGKGIDDLISFVKSQKADTGDLETTVEQLRKNITIKDQEIETIKSDYESKMFATSLKQEASAAIPDNLIEAIKKDQVLQLFLSTHELKNQDGKTVVMKNGEVMKDKQLLSPLPVDAVMKSFVEDNNWLAVNKKGRGDKNNKILPTGVEHIVDSETFFEYLDSKGIHRASQKSVEVLNKLPKDVQENILAES